ncbi:MAG: transglycosylase domain-containing protein, partial [Anaerolineae bacterium]|nr:transglycosylase domain-containing protein [Thermoflexales bacterium]MDW8408585.1 transglycosylase domain-containing protein [Anaerolineae bacterium]
MICTVVRLRRIGLALATLVIGLPLLALLALWFTLPAVDDLYRRAQAPSTRILDRNGRLLYEIIDPRAGHHTPVPLDSIPLRLRQATIAVEDASFYTNPGVDLIGIVRALWINIQGGEVLAGGSTITQQVARMMLLEPEERAQRTLLRKLRESMLAWQIAQRYSKDEVLALYLNQSYYGNLAYGVEAAARAYFGKPVGALDLAECALLAGLVQAPALYDPFTAPARAKARQAIVLDLMAKHGYITVQEAEQARQTRLSYAPPAFSIRAPHFVSYARLWLEEHFGPERITRGGLVVTTTLDLSLNDAATEIVRARLRQLQQPLNNQPGHNVRNAAVVALDPSTGAVLAMVGSPAYFDADISGALNATLALRQPGSAIKPITYAAAFQRLPRFTPATPILDVRTAFPTREGTPYLPENYDRRFHGPISARYALATSNNVAAVRVLQQVG